MNDTDESVRSIYAREDAENFEQVLAALAQPGASLVRPPKLDAYYVDFGQGPVGRLDGGGRLSQGAVKKLERAKRIYWVGIGRYALRPEGQAAP